MISHPVFLQERQSELIVQAHVVEAIDESHLKCIETEWAPILRRHHQDLINQGKPLPENWHWRWRDKVSSMKGVIAVRTFAIECRGRTQGVMLVNTAFRSRLPGQRSKELAYIDYVETAPWNQRSITASPQFAGVGVTMVRTAIAVSHEEDGQGRIGLHSLPSAETFYADRCQMTDLGLDGTKQNLRYFEMTPQQAAAFSS